MHPKYAIQTFVVNGNRYLVDISQFAIKEKPITRAKRARNRRSNVARRLHFEPASNDIGPSTDEAQSSVRLDAPSGHSSEGIVLNTGGSAERPTYVAAGIVITGLAQPMYTALETVEKTATSDAMATDDEDYYRRCDKAFNDYIESTYYIDSSCTSFNSRGFF